MIKIYRQHNRPREATGLIYERVIFKVNHAWGVADLGFTKEIDLEEMKP